MPIEQSSDKWENVRKSIDTTMLPPAINLYRYYQEQNGLEEQNSLKEQYEELLKLVCRGIVRYADINCNKAEKAIKQINQELQNIWTINTSLLEDFRLV